MNAYFDWDEKKHGKNGIKEYDEDAKKYICKNAFFTFISKDEDIPNDNSISRKVLLRKDKQDGTFGGHVIIYKSKNKKVEYIDEKGVEQIGTLDIIIFNGKNYEGDSFDVNVELGGTHINVTAFHPDSHTSSNAVFENIEC